MTRLSQGLQTTQCSDMVCVPTGSLLALHCVVWYEMKETISYHVVKKGGIRLEMNFALTEPINVIVYSEFDASIKIDKNRSIMTQ